MSPIEHLGPGVAHSDPMPGICVHPTDIGHRVDSLCASVVTMLPGAIIQPQAHDGYEIAVMLKGEIACQIGDARYDLRRGDSIAYWSRRTHAARNHQPGDAMFLLIETSQPLALAEEQRIIEEFLRS